MDYYDLFAVGLAVWFALRKLDARSCEASQQAHVLPDDFASWQRRAVAAYGPGMYASFFRVLFHIGFVRYVAHHPLSPLTFGRVALLVDFIWLVSVITTLVRANAARALRQKLGIVLQKSASTR